MLYDGSEKGCTSLVNGGYFVDIAAMSINSQTQLQTGVDVLMLKKTMDISAINSQIMLESLVPPSLYVGTKIDINV
jgi:hypothetical protein